MADRPSTAGNATSRPPAFEPRVGERSTTQLRYGAKGLVVEDGRVLLLRERRSDGSTFWTLPGGGVRPNETFAEGLGRELREEIDCLAWIGAPEATCRYRHASLPSTVTMYTIHRCDLRGTPVPNEADDVIAASWFPPDALPETTLRPIARSIEEMTEGLYDSPAMPPRTSRW